MTASETEARRIRAEFERREREVGRGFYALTTPANLFTRHHQERALLDALDRTKLLPLAEKRILDVGCGRGDWLAVLEDFGAQRHRLAGIDLDAQRLADCETRFSGADLRVGDASELPWPDGSFEIVMQSTVFTSILDEDMRRAVASEMLRVLAPGGTIIWYDFRYNNPQNPHVRRVGAREIRELFPGCAVELRTVTLAPPLARRIVSRSWMLAAGLEKLRVLNTHYLGVIQRR